MLSISRNLFKSRQKKLEVKEVWRASYLLRAARFSSAVMGGAEPNSKSMVRGIVTSRPGDLGVSSDVVLSSVRTVGSESVPVEMEEGGSLEPPPKRPLILSIATQSGISANLSYPSPLMESCLTSPTAMASEMETKPDSERAMVVLMTGSKTPFSVRLAMASATPPILASTIP